jgi:hypothetical protein
MPLYVSITPSIQSQNKSALFLPFYEALRHFRLFKEEEY